MSSATAKARPWETGKPGKGAPTATLPEAKAPATAPEPEKSNSNFAGLIDELAKVRSDKSALEAREKELKEQLKGLGLGEHAGGKCRLIIKEVETSRLDTTAIKAALTDDMIARFTKKSTETRFEIKALV